METKKIALQKTEGTNAFFLNTTEPDYCILNTKLIGELGIVLEFVLIAESTDASI